MRSAIKIGAVTLAAAFFCLALTSAAGAADSVYWVNYAASKISHANVGESGGGGDIPIAATGTLDGPWGLAIDAAAGKVYWANKNNDTIGYANLDGSGAGLLNTSGATVDEPSGLAIDPTAGRVYWANFGADKISYANLNGSGGGDLNAAGATVEGPTGVVAYPAAGRVYWTNYTASKISFANLNGSGGADLNAAGAPLGGPEGAAIDAAAGRIYWANIDAATIGYANLDGSGGGQLDIGRLIEGEPVGVAIDPASRIYWGNRSTNLVESSSLSFAGGGWNIQGAGATRDAVAFPVLLESPRVSQLPTVEGQHLPGTTLTCSQGKWRSDLIESFLYLAPQSFSYQWYRNGKAEAGATSPSFTANKVGAYSCVVTATNYAGSDSEVSPIDFSVNATVGFKKVTYNRKKGTATLRVVLTGTGRLDLYGNGVANAQRKRAKGTAKLIVRASGRARIKLAKSGRATVKARVSYTPEGGKAIKRFKTVVLKKNLKR
jgi:DNA-binding beta-propeller fold protein YncE